eukprot:3743894-Rhodomonas_salina.3
MPGNGITGTGWHRDLIIILITYPARGTRPGGPRYPGVVPQPESGIRVTALSVASGCLITPISIDRASGGVAASLTPGREPEDLENLSLR